MAEGLDERAQRASSSMLAYVFWHWPQGDADQRGYETALIGFHRRLAGAPPKGFCGSAVFGVAGVPWAAGREPLFEDWYLVEDFAALGVLNEAAVSAANKRAHDRAAVASAGGAGGVYRMRRGRGGFGEARFATWFAKPRGVTYADFYRGVPQRALASGAALWERQMNLGPALECCVIAAEPVRVAGAQATTVVTLTPVYAGL